MSLDDLASFDPYPVGIRADGRPVVLPPRFVPGQMVVIESDDDYDGCVAEVIGRHRHRPHAYWLSLAGEPRMVRWYGAEELAEWVAPSHGAQDGPDPATGQ